MSTEQRQRVLALILNGLPGWAVMLAGIMVVVISLAADSLSLGAQPGIVGWKQMAGAAFGGLVAIAGVWYAISSLREARAGPDSDGGMTQTVPEDGEVIYDSAAPRIPFLHEIIELYRYRYLLWNLISRDLKVRYKRSVLGFVWAMVNPLLTMGVLVIVFVQLFRFQIENYPIYILSGLLIWNLFSSGTSIAMRSVLNNAGIRKKIYVPASVFVASAIGSALVNLAFAVIPLLLMTLFFRMPPRLEWVLLPIPIVLTTILTFGVGVIVAAFAVFFADILDIYDVLLRAFFYLTPIIYPIAILPRVLTRAQMLNPLHQFISIFRVFLMGEGTIEPLGILIAIIVTTTITLAGWTMFTRLSDEFAYRA